MRPGLTPLLLALFALLPVDAAVAREEARPGAAAGAKSIESCVDRQVIRFGADDRRVVLDAADAASVSAALIRRYPVVDHDGLAPQRIVLWKKPAAEWLYIALLENPARPNETCFTATFVASRFDITPQMITKYFGGSMPGE